MTFFYNATVGKVLVCTVRTVRTYFDGFCSHRLTRLLSKLLFSSGVRSQDPKLKVCLYPPNVKDTIPSYSQ